MKFGALLRTSAQEVPDLQGLFVCYKQLKKRLKRLPGREEQNTASATSRSVSVRENERAFVALLISDIQAFNDTFVEREEQSVIQLSLIEERAASAQTPEEVAAVYKSYVDFHGQTLMLVHWSILAYTSVLKILKKHYKRTGSQVQAFNMQQVLSQPFCSVELVSGLVRKAEDKAQELAGRLDMRATQASLSAASPASSPVAELISAARASVQEIADSVARGNEALDLHLREQPTSSDEASAEAGEAEVMSGPARTQQNGKSLKEAEQHNSSGDAVNGKAAVEKRSHAVAVDGEGRKAKLARHSILNAQPNAPGLHRTGSVAGDSEVPNAAATIESPGVSTAEARDAVAEAHASPVQPDKANGRDSAGDAHNLTMEQGWGGGGSQNILRQTQMALGLWEQLHCTASTPSTVVPPLQPSKQARGSANSAA